MRNFSYRRIVAALALMGVVSGAGCTKGPDTATIEGSKPKTLKIWAVIDDTEEYGSLLSDYQKAHPHISLDFRRFRLEEYEDVLVNAMAEDRGPDIFMVHNTWIGKYQPKIEPMPAYTSMVYKYVSGGYTNRTETVELKKERSLTVKDMKGNYPDTVYKDMVRRINTSPEGQAPRLEDKIMAVPMSVDTLAMYVNKDMLNAAGIPIVPDTWDKFQATMQRLVKVDDEGNILQAGAALGTANNVERATDLLSVLMMQNGAVMSRDEDNRPTFAQMPEALSATRQNLPAVESLRFYLEFANPTKDIYTWNAEMPNSLDAFIQGRVAFFFGYAYHLPLIQARAPKLNLTIAKLPQIEGNPIANYANYWAWTVSKKSKNTETAWNFLNYLIQPDNEQKYLETAKRPAAHKALIEKQLEDEQLGVFASQILTSRSWYRGADAKAMESAFTDMISQGATLDDDQLQRTIINAQELVEQSMDRPVNP